MFCFFCDRKYLTLPDPSRISSWISSVEANPGFLTEVLQAISKFSDEKRDVNLILDAMSIKRMLQWDAKREKMWGYCDFGQIEVDTGEIEATEVLVFMAACLNGSWKLPIAYFFQDKCSAVIQGELLKTALLFCHQANLRTRSVTCDGSNTNYASLKTLGFSNKFNPDSIECELKYKVDGVEKVVHFTPDACHAAKLARNALGKVILIYVPLHLVTLFVLLNLFLLVFSHSLCLSFLFTKIRRPTCVGDR